ncbi:MAG: RnfABCDGE type electron transport complex subunit D [Treponema sp.]|nr:RnfABCDGE type electron transport complex subunit D [Treponema sp.]
MSDTNKIYLSSSPHFTRNSSVTWIMATVLTALLPECIYAVILFGLRALLTILISVASCVCFEALFQIITRQKVVISNLSAAVTGVLLALVIPSTTPFWMTILGAFVAVVVAKGLFGGIGSNVFNPALTGRAVMFMSFASVMGASWFNPSAAISKWSLSQTGLSNVDALSSATILSGIKAGSLDLSGGSLMDLVMGNQAGCMGETSVILILISFVFLLATGIIDFRAPVAMVGTVALATGSAALLGGSTLALAGYETLLALCTGGLLFGAVFMVTDYATSPVTKPGRWIFGLGCGLITFLIRRFGGYPEGVMFSILIMNALVPFLNNITVRKYGYGKNPAKKEEAK